MDPEKLKPALQDLVVESLNWLRTPSNVEKIEPSYQKYANEVKYDEYGWPKLTDLTFQTYGSPRHEKSVFDFSMVLYRVLEQFTAWKPFIETALTYDRILWFYSLEDSDSTSEELARIDPQLGRSWPFRLIKSGVGDLVDRYLHRYNTFELDEANFGLLYTGWYNNIFADKLEFDVIVPILGLSFEDAQIAMADGVEIVRMTDTIQLQRGIHGQYRYYFNSNVTRAATFAVVSRGWEITNVPQLIRHATVFTPDYLRTVLARIDLVFAAIRAVTGFQTGYSQILIQADGWCDHSYGGLPTTHAVSVRQFPESFETQGVWLSKPADISGKQCLEIAETYNWLGTVRQNKVALAARRLNQAYLRSSDDDAIVDAIIGLEALIGDGNAEMTHKIASRIAAIRKLNPVDGLSPYAVFRLTKKIYAQRSAIVHGTHETKTDKQLVTPPHGENERVQSSIGMLRHLVVTLAKFPEYLEPTKIDELMLD